MTWSFCHGVIVLQVTSGEAAQAQEYLLSHGKRVRRMADVLETRKERRRARGGTAASFRSEWVYGREVTV